MIYSRVKDGVIYCTVSEHYDIEVSNTDYWIGHDSAQEYPVGSVYPPVRIIKPRKPSAWNVTSMDAEPIQFNTTTT